MRRWVLGFWMILASAATAQEMTLPQAESFYHDAKSTLDLQDYPAPFAGTAQILDDPEHGTNGPDRLPFFHELRQTAADSTEAERRALIAWLIRYAWQKPEPNYTQGAVRLLRELSTDDALWTVMAMDMLRNHPHGAARAAVVEYHETYSAWLESPEIATVLRQLAFTDPHPDMRRAAIGHLYNAEFPPGRLEKALATDPAAEIRVVWARVIARDLPAERADPALRKALFAPENRSVAPALLSAYLRRNIMDPKLGRLADVASYVAANPDHPQIASLRAEMGHVIDDGNVPFLLDGAPFADGAALHGWLQDRFADDSAPLVDRARALSLLCRHDAPDLPPQDLADFLLNPAHDADTVAPLMDTVYTSCAMNRLAQDWSPGTTTQAETLQDLAQQLLDQFARQTDEGRPRMGSPAQIALLRALGRRGRADLPDTGWMIPLLMEYAAAQPVDVNLGIGEMLGNREIVDDDAFFDHMAGSESGLPYAMGQIFVDRLRPAGSYSAIELQPGDLTQAIRLIELAESRAADDPSSVAEFFDDLFYDLPPMAEIDPTLPDLPAFQAKLRDILARGEPEDALWGISSWLGE